MSLELQSQFDLTDANTLGLKSKAEHYTLIEAAEQIPELLDYVEQHQLPLLWLGGGSNIVLAETVPGVVAKLALYGREILEQRSDSVLVRVCAAEVWHDLVRWTLNEGFYGLENLALIPGSVGAAPVQNIGAYGVEVSEVITQVNAYDRVAGDWVSLSSAECGFGYRDSVFKRDSGRYVITSVEFRLEREYRPRLEYAPLAQRFEAQSNPTALQVFDAVCDIRSAKLPDPARLANAGSFFKNPIVTQAQFEQLNRQYSDIPNYPASTGRKLAAGWLIEQAGLKGFTLGPVGVHKLQALVLVNYGGASRADIIQLADLVKGRVEETFGVQLEQEPVAYPGL